MDKAFDVAIEKIPQYLFDVTISVSTVSSSYLSGQAFYLVQLHPPLQRGFRSCCCSYRICLDVTTMPSRYYGIKKARLQWHY
jgi:hypothetical protein